MSTKSYRLKMGHNTTFRRTIDPSAEKKADAKKSEAYQLVFEPGQDYELSAEELAGLEKEIETGLLVPTDKDEHGRQRVGPKRPEHQKPVKKGPDGEEVSAENQSLTAGGKPGGRKAKGPNVGAKSTVVTPAAAKKAARAAKKASAKKK